MKKPKNSQQNNITRDDYNKIAPQFSSTRSYEWPEMRIFTATLEKKSKAKSLSGEALAKTAEKLKVLDLGCGNGRLIASLSNLDVDYLGIDNSEKLLKIAQETYPKWKLVEMDMTALELSNDSIDACFAIASLHHLPTKLLRRKALSEAFRVTKTNGYLFVTVWNLWQPKYRKYIFKNIYNIIFRNSRTHFGDTFIPFKDKNQKILADRYYFAYTKKGLRRDLETVGFQVVEISKSRWNLYAICKK